MQKFFFSIFLLFITLFAIAQNKSVSHQVEKGETFYSIAKMYHVTVEALQKANKLPGDAKLKIGQKLFIPSSASTAKATETKVEKPAPSKAPKPEVIKVSQNPPADGPSTHIVVKGETVYAIAKANGLTWKQLKEANHLSDDMKLKLGQKLIIPSRNPEAMYKADTDVKSVVAPKPESAVKTTEQGKDYLSAQPAVIKTEPVKAQDPEPVKPIETKTMAPAPVKTEKPKENTQDENPFAAKPATAATNTSTTTSTTPPAKPVETIKNDNVNPNDYAAVFGQYGDSGKKKVVYRGIGVFMQSDNPGNQFLALYNYADMGSILKVTNLMSKESIFVKVIGKVPATDAQKDVILKVSSEAATKLKVTEDKFLVEVTGFNIQ